MSNHFDNYNSCTRKPEACVVEIILNSWSLGQSRIRSEIEMTGQCSEIVIHLVTFGLSNEPTSG